MIKFENDDEGYFAWLAANPGGYVLNVREKSDSNYVVLHRATCGSISSPKVKPGAYTGRNYNKWCARTLSEIRYGATREGRTDGSFSKRCGRCKA